MATAMRRSQYLTSFVLSRLLFLFLEIAALVGFGWLMFRVGVRGSLGSLALVTVLGALSFAGLGMLVASRARTIEAVSGRSEEHTSELQSQSNLVCRLLLEKKKKQHYILVVESVRISGS